jgi:hypothetical protein
VPFWILKPINLRNSQDTSPLIDVDVLTDSQKTIINSSINRHEIAIYDKEGNHIPGNLKNVNVVEGNHVSTDDIDEEEELYPEIVSVTSGTEPDLEEEIPKEVFEDAEVMLNKNGNTVKKLVSAMDVTDTNAMLLKASLELEYVGKNRPGVIKYIKKALLEY